MGADVASIPEEEVLTMAEDSRVVAATTMAVVSMRRGVVQVMEEVEEDMGLQGVVAVTSQFLKQRKNEFPYFQNLEVTKTLFNFHVLHNMDA
jgi:hypothetical protein